MRKSGLDGADAERGDGVVKNSMLKCLFTLS